MSPRLLAALTLLLTAAFANAQDSAPPPRAATTVTVAASPATVAAGGSAVLSITATGTPAPTGTVTLRSGAATVATLTLASGHAAMSASSQGLAAGVYPLTATYGGDTNYVPATSATINVVVLATQPSIAAAARFLDQATFGPTAASIAHVQQIGFNAALAEQFAQPATPFTQPPVNDAECSSSNWHCTQSEYLSVTAFGADQLRQRVALALSEIWVAPIHEDNAMPWYLNTLAADAFTNYRTLMNDLALSPQMGDYLNMRNSAAAPAGQIANENFARELMQLFALGPNLLNLDGSLQMDAQGNPIPTYTEAQVQAFARAYTGWTNANADGTTPTRFNYTNNWQHAMVAVEKYHDHTAKTLLNGTTLAANQTAQQDLDAALDNVFAHANVGPFVSRQLIQHLVTGDPSPQYVARVAAVFADNGSGVRGDMRAVITAVLMDPEARAADFQSGDQLDAAPAINGGHLREPLLWLTNVLRGMGATQATAGDAYPFVSLMQASMQGLGEAPFTQPSVFNYFSPSTTIPAGDFATGAAPATPLNAPEFGLENTGSIAPRSNLADALLHNKIAGLAIDTTATSPLGQQAANPAALVDSLGLLFMHGQMPTAMRTILINAVTAIPATAPQTRVQVAAYLVLTSSEYKILH